MRVPIQQSRYLFSFDLLVMGPRARRIISSLLYILMSLMPQTELFAGDEVKQQDILLASSGLGLAIGLELAKSHLTPEIPRFSTPLAIDTYMRDKFRRGAGDLDKAEIWSDRLIYGVSLSSLIWGPLVADDRAKSFLINMEVFSLNSLVTNLTKILVARERPYKHFGTRESLQARDNTSFFSGHSSVAFSQAVCNAMILSEHYPDQEAVIWSSLLTLAGTTAYLRVASDMHYFSDIIVGAAVGSLIAWTLTRHELNRFEKKYSNGMNFSISLRIPLG